MMEALAAGLVILSGAPLVFVLVMVIGLINPWIGLASIWAFHLSKRGHPSPWSVDVRFSRGVADELRGGSSLRQAFAEAAEDIGEGRLARVCRSGRPYEEMASGVEACLPLTGQAAGAAIRIAGESGGRVADAFEAIALLAEDEQALKNERRAASAQARTSALIIAVLPVLLVVLLVGAGRMDVLLSGGSLSVGLMTTGFGLITVGLVTIWQMVRRAELA
ncbi:MAG: type II secretion system F family protein [Acidimicrobiia bacterium]|nr:type II secretion system F family protein [Acidimicrobiia bacterium]